MDITSLTNHLFEKITSVSVDRCNLEKIGKVAVITWATYLVSSKLYDAFVGPLSGIPGPLGLKFYEMRYAPGVESPPGTSWEKLKKWRNQYGDVVRLGPNRIGISDKRMLRQILLKDDLPKGPMYTRLQRRSPPTLFNTREKAFHKQRRRVISPAFSVKYLNSLETYMRGTTQAFIERIDRDIEQTQNDKGYGQVDIWILLQYLALDIIGETAFGKTFHMLEGNDHIVPRTISSNMEKSSYIVTHPILGVLLMMLPFSGILKANDELKAFMKKIIMERLLGGEEARRDDILQILIDTQHANDTEDRLTADTIAQETVLFLVAGSETTSNTTGFAMIELMKNPQAFAKLQAEIDAVEFEEDQKLFHSEQLKHLPYLNAVINETLRLDSIAVGGAERIADRDVVLDGRVFVPKGVILHANIYHAQVDEKYWPEPEKWIPERWIENSGYPAADQEAFFPFSVGSRNCIGKTFAQQEMRLSIANLVKLYDIVAIPEEVASAEERRAFITLAVKSNSYKVMMKRRTTTA
ncbi:cytochrome P450 [Zychaea mexicana]|uniref:cytochrome P450 n=1 Tax=Zychaea mexicana TaxID=64656 RepID=UPI0022FEA080|nr:cytochrome P450 [Zychaea mexicana]KAI9499050.1 cytochrome P450 [Zychaea mexicana]